MSVSVQDLSLQQLTEVKRQLDEELSHLTSSFAQLKQAQVKFRSCLENVAELKPENADKVILVPLTNSLYVPGKLANPETVIIDVGTGYFVKKSRDDARKHYQHKVDYVQSNLQTLQETIEKKQDNMNMLLAVMREKMSAPAGST